VRFIPAGAPPHRAAPIASAADRLAMIELALAGHPGLVADAREIARPGPSYTVLTLEELRREDPARPLALIVGADAFLGLAEWHRWREIFALAHLVVVARPGVVFDPARVPALLPEWNRRRTGDPQALVTTAAGAILTHPVTAHDISATALRALLAQGPSGVDAARRLLPPAVLAYIERNQLYRSPPCPSERSPESP
jgi:nicotinate-nucleotide adenylyltransferase